GPRDGGARAAMPDKRGGGELHPGMPAEMGVARLRGGEGGRPRLDEALDELWPYALGVLDDELRPELSRRVEAKLGRTLPDVEPVPRGRHAAELDELLDEMTIVRRSAPAGGRRGPRGRCGGRAG